MKTNKELILFSCGLLGWVFGQLCWVYLGGQAYYISIAILIFILIYIIHLNTDSWRKHITRLAMFISFNNLVDEVLFDPTKFDWNEILIVLLYTLFNLIQWIKYKSSQHG